MNVDELVRDSLREQADEQPALGPGFAERVLTVRRRRRARALASAAAATAAVVALAVAVPLLHSGKDDVRLANVLAHPDQTPPHDLIAAGDVAMAAYYTWDSAKQADGREFAVRTYRLLDPKTDTYVKTTKWSRVAVAPGMRTAAVLERNLPAKRIGLLNMVTGEVERWIPVDHGVADVEFSPDGGKLVATTYSKNPDLLLRRADRDGDGDGDKDWVMFGDEESHTGFYVLDVASGKGAWSEADVADQRSLNQDFSFSRDGKLIHSGTTSPPYRQYYDFAGNQVAAPANEAHVSWRNGLELSPDGKLVGGGFQRPHRPSEQSRWILIDPRTGKPVTTVRGYELLAWLDNKRLIAWDYAPGTKEPRFRLALVTIGSDEAVPLSGFSKAGEGGTLDWTPVFAER
ncbi:WD40 repeat domain-containing protein [Streptomyces sp. NPDC058691]|uniref:WD40 repeat domain-containing protein n=1 Tax=Streptomyces sp. NPDC058691 TaxID=3346601 RepID=UPI003660FDA7